MSDRPSPTDRLPLFERLKQARIVQVLVVYLGASWVVLQMADTLVDLLSLPDWVGPVAVLLLALWGGLMRMGWALPTPVSDLGLLHGPLMVGGFLGSSGRLLSELSYI